MSYLQIKRFEGTPKEFYALMGKFFAESKYQKEMPYMVNRATNVWFLAFKEDALVGFGAVNELKNKIVLEHSYVEEEYRKLGIWKLINEARFEYSKFKVLPIEVITKEDYLKKYWLENGFEIFKTNGRYNYLRKEVDTCIII